MSTERDELAYVIVQHPWIDPELFGVARWPKGYCPTCGRIIEAGHNSPAHAEHIADAILAAGYRRHRTVTTAKEANELPDRSAILTPGQIIFRKWEDYYGEGNDAWERELGQVVPAELLGDEAHFPATVLHEGES